ncbi:hypothetical protein PRNP1_005628 [Phytophthora ramorum]
MVGLRLHWGLQGSTRRATTEQLRLGAVTKDSEIGSACRFRIDFAAPSSNARGKHPLSNVKRATRSSSTTHRYAAEHHRRRFTVDFAPRPSRSGLLEKKQHWDLLRVPSSNPSSDTAAIRASCNADASERSAEDQRTSPDIHPISG